LQLLHMYNRAEARSACCTSPHLQRKVCQNIKAGAFHRSQRLGGNGGNGDIIRGRRSRLAAGGWRQGLKELERRDLVFNITTRRLRGGRVGPRNGPHHRGRRPHRLGDSVGAQGRRGSLFSRPRSVTLHVVTLARVERVSLHPVRRNGAAGAGISAVTAVRTPDVLVASGACNRKVCPLVLPNLHAAAAHGAIQRVALVLAAAKDRGMFGQGRSAVKARRRRRTQWG